MQFPRHKAVSEVSVIVLEFVLRQEHHLNYIIPLQAGEHISKSFCIRLSTPYSFYLINSWT